MIKKTTEQFIKDAILVHGDKFDYSLSKYCNAKTKIKIICPNKHIFEQIPNDHLNGHGCKKCSGWGEMKNNNETFLKRIEEIHGKDIICEETFYKNHNEKVTLHCPKHGFFEKAPKELLIKKQGCIKCGYEKSSSKNKMSLEVFIKKSNQIHDNKYNYSLVNYKNANTKVEIICPKHGIFLQCPKDHINQLQGCPLCAVSKGEKEILKYLKENNIKYIPQHAFDNCVNEQTGRKLFFDFYIPEYNLCIEFDGEQHFFPLEIFGGAKKFNYLIQRDEIKNKYCKENNINILRIKYNQFKQINNILNNYVEHFKNKKSSHRAKIS